MRNTFDLVRAAYMTNTGTWIAIDFEAWEMFHKDLTEFGYAIIGHSKTTDRLIEEGHWIVQERRHLRNVRITIQCIALEVLICDLFVRASI